MASQKRSLMPKDEVDRAIEGIARAVTKVVKLLGDEDTGLAARAAHALLEVGPFAAGPMAASLARAASPHHRARILGTMLQMEPRPSTEVMRALNALQKR